MRPVFALKGRRVKARGFNLWNLDASHLSALKGRRVHSLALSGREFGSISFPEVETSGCIPSPFQGENSAHIQMLKYLAIFPRPFRVEMRPVFALKGRWVKARGFNLWNLEASHLSALKGRRVHSRALSGRKFGWCSYHLV
jgi:hypothetical protein